VTKDFGRNVSAPSETRQSFDEHLKPVLNLAYRYAFTLTGNRDSGMDLVQETSVAAYRAFDQFQLGTNFKAWFLKILTNRYFRDLRSAGHLPSIPLDEAPELFLYRQARRLGVPTKDDPFEFLLNKVDGELIRKAMLRLPEEYKVVATLHFLTEVTYEECAETLDIPVGTVRSRLHRARRMLQVSLWALAEERGYVPKEERT
jgi:RNA polymerase sigma-70 factor (ECF subfamily)